MSFNRTNLGRIREDYNTKFLRAEEEATRRKIELWAKIPGLQSIDRRMAQTGPRLLAVALRQSTETFEEIRADNDRLSAERAALMTAAGYAPDYTEPQYECPVCRDQGYVGNRMCSCMRNRLIEAGYRSSGIANLMKTQSFETFDLNYYRSNERVFNNMTFIYSTMKEYAETFDPASSPNLALFGGTGLGKTHLSTSVAKVVIERGYDVVYTGTIGMLADFERARFGNSSGNESGNGTDRYFECDLLIVDDLGAEVANQFTVSCVYNIINDRINLGLPTILSTNLSPAELNTRYWDRITSRILGEYRPLVFTGTDVRKLKLN